MQEMQKMQENAKDRRAGGLVYGIARSYTQLSNWACVHNIHCIYVL